MGGETYTHTLCDKPGNWAEGPKTGPKAQKEGRRPSLVVFGPNTDQDYAGCRPALIESLILPKTTKGNTK